MSQPLKRTKLENWRLRVERGRQVWHYLQSECETEQWPQTDSDRYWLGLQLKDDRPLSPPKTPLDAARNGFEFYKRLQTEDGHWAGEYGGPNFLIPGYVFTMYISKSAIPEHERMELLRYLLNIANEDGGWGIHTEGVSTVFGTALNYTCCRLLGLDPDDRALVNARGTLHKLGGATGIPSWGKFWLSCLNVYDWDGMNPVPPELWLLPTWLPFHPSRWWVHTRMVYLPMGLLYAKRCKAEVTDLIREVREELYGQPYSSIEWKKQRSNISPADAYYPHTSLLKVLYSFASAYECVALKSLRQMALDESWRQIKMEDENTGYGNLASVNKVMNMLCTYFQEGPDSAAFMKHKEKCREYLWMSGKGMLFNGTDGSQVWDTCWVIQAVCEGGLATEGAFQESMQRALDFLDTQQIRNDPPNRESCYRDATKGAWPFSKVDQGYTLSDCTAEAIKCVFLLQELEFIQPRVSESRLCEAVDILLSLQNADGGFSTYEKTRGPFLLETINPAEVFGNIMIEYSYVECTTASVLGLSAAKKRYPTYRTSEITNAIEGGFQFIKQSQRPDGSWYGSWAICFTYGTWFGLEALANAGEFYENSEHARKACDFLVSRQKDDGGWGETYKSCETHVYQQHPKSQVVNTCWALLGLMASRYPDATPIKRGIQLLMARQLPNGEWLQESIEGVFNRNAMISYPNYKFAFPKEAIAPQASLSGGNNCK
ncbi:terpene synthase, partial [Basidiobolus meristosporus CBS 931.73]